jgi:rRNA maturation RNase YbeY
MINIFSSSRYKLNKKFLREYAQSIVNQYQATTLGVVNIIFVGKRKMLDIANEYKHENVALPVLSFPYKDDKNNSEHMLGEIFLCYPQVVLLAAEREKKVEEVTKQLIEHGIQNLFK